MSHPNPLHDVEECTREDDEVFGDEEQDDRDIGDDEYQALRLGY